MVLESSTFVSCLHKQIPFVSILVEVRKQSLWTPWYRPIFVVVRFHRLIHSFQYHSVYQEGGEGREGVERGEKGERGVGEGRKRVE